MNEPRFYLQSLDGVPWFDRHGSLVQTSHLDGIFAYNRYSMPDWIVMRELVAYGSHHGGLHVMLQWLKESQLQQQTRFFSSSMSSLSLPKAEPLAAGKVWFLNGEVVLFDLESGAYSFKNPAFHDTCPQLLASVEDVGFPVSRFIRLAQATWFNEHVLRNLFAPNGQPLDPWQTKYWVNDVCHLLALPALPQAPQPSSLPHLSGRTLVFV